MNYSSDYQVLMVRSLIIKDKSLNMATGHKPVGSVHGALPLRYYPES